MQVKNGISVLFILLALLVSACTYRHNQKSEGKEGQSSRSFASGDLTSFMQSLPAADPARKHVHLMHLDGFRADVFKILLEKGRLPHFQFLLGRGKVAYDASTVDKSETFKVVESYLTSRRDTFITGWWQFNRSNFAFKNYWIDPPEVVNYELGLTFPTAPTIYDVIADKSGPQSVAAGFTLHRRNVPAGLYTRNFAAGLQSVSEHLYFDQAHATMGSFIELLRKIGKSPSRQIPKFTSSLLAPADEWGHLQGIAEIDPGRGDRTCFKRTKKTEILFKIYNDPAFEGIALADSHFVEVKRAWGGRGAITEVCVDRFTVEIANEPPSPNAENTVGTFKQKGVNPLYILGMIQVDLELGRLIDEMRRIQFLCLEGGDHCYNDRNPKGIGNYVRNGQAETSLFENTLFLFTGDHGMVDTKYMMTESTPLARSNGRSSLSKNEPLLVMLNRGLGLKTPSEQQTEGPFGITDSKLPPSIMYPFEDKSWQSPEIQVRVAEAQAMAEATFAEAQAAIKDKQYQKYWWLSVLRKSIIDPKIAASMGSIKPYAIRLLTSLYLQGDLCARNPNCYINEEAKFLKTYYDRHVKFIYGGAALNNGEFFIPSSKGWGERPTGAEILEYTPGNRKSVIKTLQDMESIGLIFFRGNNELFHPKKLPPPTTDIIVMDHAGNMSVIHVKRDEKTGVLLFAYEISAGVDPLGYGDLCQPMESKPIWRTYEQWNQLSISRKHFYHNAVAGMGTYLFSNNPHIGDITVMHRTGWNFGDNGGGHGGIHREEKQTVMMASGPQIKKGTLRSRANFEVNPKTGKVIRSGVNIYPTVVDIAPTALDWLGYGKEALLDHQIQGFTENLQRWKRAQSKTFVDDFIAGFEKEVKGTSQEGMIDLRRLKPRLKRLFQFMENQKFEPPRGYLSQRPDGNFLNLDE